MHNFGTATGICIVFHILKTEVSLCNSKGVQAPRVHEKEKLTQHIVTSSYNHLSTNFLVNSYHSD